MKYLETQHMSHLQTTNLTETITQRSQAYRVMLLVDAVEPIVVLRLHVLLPVHIPSVQHQLLHTTKHHAHIDSSNQQSNTKNLNTNFQEQENTTHKASTWGLASRPWSLRSSGKSPPAAETTSAPPTPAFDGSLRGGLAGRRGAMLSKYPRTSASTRAASSGGRCWSLRAGRVVAMAA